MTLDATFRLRKASLAERAAKLVEQSPGLWDDPTLSVERVGWIMCVDILLSELAESPCPCCRDAGCDCQRGAI